MTDALGLFGTILAVVQLIGTLASKAINNRSQSKHKCVELAERVRDLACVLHDFPHAAANDMATAGVQERLKGALDEALRLIKYCQEGGILSGKYCCRKVTELDNVDKTITNCVMDLLFISTVRGHTTSPVPAIHHYNYNQANGGASRVCVAWPPPQQQHAGSTSQAPYYQPTCVSWPSPPQQHASSTSQAPYYQPSCVGWPSPQQQHEGSTSQAPYYQPPFVGWTSPVLFPGSPPYPAYPTLTRSNCITHNSSSALIAFGCSAHDLELFREEEQQLKKHRSEDDFLASTPAEEEAAVNRVLKESLASARAEEEAAAVNRVLEESLASARAEEADRLQAKEEVADVNRVLEESLASAQVEDMVRALDKVLQREEFH